MFPSLNTNYTYEKFVLVNLFINLLFSFSFVNRKLDVGLLL